MVNAIGRIEMDEDRRLKLTANHQHFKTELNI